MTTTLNRPALSAESARKQAYTQSTSDWLDHADTFRRLAAVAFERAQGEDDSYCRRMDEDLAIAYTSAYIACTQKGMAMQTPVDTERSVHRLPPSVTEVLLDYAQGRVIDPRDTELLRQNALVEYGTDRITREGMRIVAHWRGEISFPRA